MCLLECPTVIDLFFHIRYHIQFYKADSFSISFDAYKSKFEPLVFECIMVTKNYKIGIISLVKYWI